jgi:2-iminoacetate synthase ThiH
VRETRKRFPGMTPHFFTASEVQTMAQVANTTIADVLAQLKDAGQVSLPAAAPKC